MTEISSFETRFSHDQQTDCRQYLEIDEIRVIIYGVKDVYNRRTEKAKPLYVVFGIGGTQFRTSTLTSYEPKWREDQTFSISSEYVPLRISLYEQTTNADDDDPVLGKVTLDIRELPEEADSQELLTKFLPSYHEQIPKGYLRHECYITRYREKSQYRAVAFLKQQVPRVADSFYNIQWPSLSCLWKPCMKRSQRSRSRSTVDKAIVDALIVKGTDEHGPMPAEIIMFPFMSKQSVKKHGKKDENVNKKAYRLQKRSISLSVPDLSTITAPRRKVTGFFGNVDLSVRKKENVTMTRSDSCPNISSIPESFRKKSVYQRATRQSEIYEAIAKKRKDESKIIVPNSPVILAVDPPSGSVWGGTRLKIQGTSLGLDTSDITGLYICGSSCLSTLQYESPELIYCVTKSWRACVGSILVITSSGGRSSSNVKFTFSQEAETPARNVGTVVSFAPTETSSEAQNSDDIYSDTLSLRDEPDLSSFSRSGSLDQGNTNSYFRILNCVDEGTQTYESLLNVSSQATKGPNRKRSGPLSQDYTELKDENQFLKETVDSLHIEMAKLKARNGELQSYVDDLVADVLQEAPGALGVKRFQ